MKLLKDYFELQKQIHEYFGYVEKVGHSLQIEDCTDYFWKLESDEVCFANSIEDLINEEGSFFKDEYFTKVNKHILETDKYTAVCIRSCDFNGNYLCIYDNSKRINIHE